ncbi:MAG: hypothetical protein OEV00_01625 [Acidobacteriota bacterium]|nr:hypothetical protein [Acidobacteriota bacterium]MDH3784007.1 hypothetical protein [Acidobacteriota bacterium]
MSHPLSPRLFVLPFGLLPLLVGLSFNPAGAQVELGRSTVVSLEISPLTGEARVDTLPLRIELDPVKGGHQEFVLVWPDNPATAREVTVTLTADAPKFDQRPGGTFRLTTTVTGLDDGPVETRQEFWVQDGGTSLLEVLRVADDPLTLAIRMSTREVPFVANRGTEVGVPLTLNLEIHRIEGESSTRLETNRMQTFVGQPVSYSFDLGGQPDSPALRLTFRPTRVIGEIVEIVVDANGKLPVDGQLRLIGTRETWVASRGVASSLTIAEGTPPAGYRFMVTPQF